VIHDPDLLDRLDALPKESFDGQVYRATRLSLDPLAGSYKDPRRRGHPVHELGA
jgi:hypothetical protein